jgi:biotin carboxyl carrier protein
MHAMSVVESLYVGIFGMLVVFVVLVGLGLLVRLQSALIGRFSPKKTEEVPVWEDAEHEAPAFVAMPEIQYTEVLDAEAEVITSPGPGKVLEVEAHVGEKVKSGDILVVLDAMNMEFEIDATKDGTVTQVLTSQGASVDSGTPLVEIK